MAQQMITNGSYMKTQNIMQLRMLTFTGTDTDTDMDRQVQTAFQPDQTFTHSGLITVRSLGASKVHLVTPPLLHFE